MIQRLLFWLRYLRWLVEYPGYRFGDPLLGGGDQREKNRRLIRERYEQREPKRCCGAPGCCIDSLAKAPWCQKSNG